MRHVQSDHCHPDPFARHSSTDMRGNLFRKSHHPGQFLVVQIEDVIDLTLRNHQRMSLSQRINIQKCVKILVFCDLVTGDLPIDDLRENRSHALLSVNYVKRLILQIFRFQQLAGDNDRPQIGHHLRTFRLPFHNIGRRLFGPLLGNRQPLLLTSDVTVQE